MAPRKTRSQGAPPSLKTEDTESSTPQLAPSEDNPPHVVVLPKNASRDARFVTLLCPASGTLERYFYCPDTGLYEFKKFTPPREQPRSWLLTSARHEAEHMPGYMLKDASMLMATRLDPLFILLPIFTDLLIQGKAIAKPEEDHFDTLAQTSEHMKSLLRREDFRRLLRSRLMAACSLADAAGEEVYRPDLCKVSRNIFMKAENMVRDGVWPKSLEGAFVKQPLEMPQIPVRSVPREGSEPQGEVPETENDTTAVREAVHDLPSDSIVKSLRLRTALNVILSSYVPSKLRPKIMKALEEENWVDFAELDSHLASVRARREQVQALRSMSDNVSRKRAPEDDEQAEMRAEKKRKKEEEEQKKKSESRALKNLKKVDVSGMKKVSSFFTKATAKAKS